MQVTNDNAVQISNNNKTYRLVQVLDTGAISAVWDLPLLLTRSKQLVPGQISSKGPLSVPARREWVTVMLVTGQYMLVYLSCCRQRLDPVHFPYLSILY